MMTSDRGGVVLALPFSGRWLAQNSPARRVPSHGVDVFGERYAIDFVGVDERHRSAPRGWGTVAGTEPPERFFGFGRPILAPADGTVVEVHDGEPDHVARRSQLALIPYAFGQAGRVRQGVPAIAGNHIVIALGGDGPFLALVHLRRGSFRVSVGERVATGLPVAECGNSGNSTQPHVHLQVMDRRELSRAEGIPVTFRDFREWPRGAKQPIDRVIGIPGEGAVVEPLR